jgi:hypothetical protein
MEFYSGMHNAIPTEQLRVRNGPKSGRLIKVALTSRTKEPVSDKEGKKFSKTGELTILILPRGERLHQSKDQSSFALSQRIGPPCPGIPHMCIALPGDTYYSAPAGTTRERRGRGKQQQRCRR